MTPGNVYRFHFMFFKKCKSFFLVFSERFVTKAMDLIKEVKSVAHLKQYFWTKAGAGILCQKFFQRGNPPGAGIGGRWETTWTCDREEEGFQRYSDILHVHRIGATIWGRCRFSMVDRPYLIRGRLVRGGMVNGRWKSRQPGSDYHGVFILHMGEEGDELVGSWLGTSEQLEAHHGEWRWRR